MAITRSENMAGELTSSLKYQNDAPQKVIAKNCPGLLQSYLSDVVIEKVALPYLDAINKISDYRASDYRASLQKKDEGDTSILQK